MYLYTSDYFLFKLVKKLLKPKRMIIDKSTEASTKISLSIT